MISRKIKQGVGRKVEAFGMSWIGRQHQGNAGKMIYNALHSLDNLRSDERFERCTNDECRQSASFLGQLYLFQRKHQAG